MCVIAITSAAIATALRTIFVARDGGGEAGRSVSPSGGHHS